MRISDWSSDVCSSDLQSRNNPARPKETAAPAHTSATEVIIFAGRSSWKRALNVKTSFLSVYTGIVRCFRSFRFFRKFSVLYNIGVGINFRFLPAPQHGIPLK